MSRLPSFPAIDEIELPQEAEGGRGVEIILVRRRLHRLGLDEKSSGKADALRVVRSQVQERRHLLPLLLQVRVEERRVTFPSSPENVTGAAELERGIERTAHLGRGMSEDPRAGGRRGAGGVARGAGEGGRPP